MDLYSQLVRLDGGVKVWLAVEASPLSESVSADLCALGISPIYKAVCVGERHLWRSGVAGVGDPGGHKLRDGGKNPARRFIRK